MVIKTCVPTRIDTMHVVVKENAILFVISSMRNISLVTFIFGRSIIIFIYFLCTQFDNLMKYYGIRVRQITCHTIHTCA